jgi:hypothetical protein
VINSLYFCNYNILDIIHRPVFCLKHFVSETGFCLRPAVKFFQEFYRAQLSTLHLKTDTEFSFRNFVFEIKDRTMDNVHCYDSYINIPSSQTYIQRKPVGFVV